MLLLRLPVIFQKGKTKKPFQHSLLVCYHFCRVYLDLFIETMMPQAGHRLIVPLEMCQEKFVKVC